MSDRLNYAILSMDAYNRGYGVAITELGGEGSRIGNAVIGKDAEQLLSAGLAQSAGFYAITYSYNGVKVISFRGTNTADGMLAADVIHGWPLGGGFYNADQAELAIEFYRAVVGKTNAGVVRNPYTAPIVTTGHSLGGGLAGYVAMLYGKNSWVYDTMAFEDGAGATRSDAAIADLAGDPFGFKASIYGQYAIKPTNSAGIRALQIDGQVLDLPGFVGGVAYIPTTSYDLGSDNDLGLIEKHSQALLVSRIYADEGITQTDWETASKPLWRAFFNDEIGRAHV